MAEFFNTISPHRPMLRSGRMTGLGKHAASIQSAQFGSRTVLSSVPQSGTDLAETDNLFCDAVSEERNLMGLKAPIAGFS